MSDAVPVVLGVDAGTTTAKAVLIDAAGSARGSGSSDPIDTTSDHPGQSEQRPEEIWNAVVDASRRAIQSAAIQTEVEAVAVGAQSGSVVIADHGSGRAGRAITWMDTRAQPLVSSWSAERRSLVRSLSGWSASAGLGLATISWLHTSGGFKVSDHTHWASVDDYLIRRMTGDWVTNPSNAAGMQMLDAVELDWNEYLCSLSGIDTEQLSTVLPSGSDLGPMLEPAAEEFGLSSSPRVILGGHDQACAALGLGAVEPGVMVLSMGTAWVLTVITGGLTPDQISPTFNLSPHVLASRWSASQNLGGYGAIVSSAIQSAGEPDVLDERLTGCSPTLEDGFFVPAIHDADRTEWGHFVGVDDGDESARILAVFEACGFAVRTAVNDAPSNDDETPLVAVGGGTRSRTLCQMLADVLQREVVVREDASWPALGAAKLAALSLGWAELAPVETPSVTVSPRPAYKDLYNRRYEAYTDLVRGGQR